MSSSQLLSSLQGQELLKPVLFFLADPIYNTNYYSNELHKRSGRIHLWVRYWWTNGGGRLVVQGWQFRQLVPDFQKAQYPGSKPGYPKGATWCMQVRDWDLWKTWAEALLWEGLGFLKEAEKKLRFCSKSGPCCGWLALEYLALLQLRVGADLFKADLYPQ